MIRTILVTKVENEQGQTHLIYGRYDAVALFNSGFTVKEQCKVQYEMSDSDFAKYGKIKKVKGE